MEPVCDHMESTCRCELSEAVFVGPVTQRELIITWRIRRQERMKRERIEKVKHEKECAPSSNVDREELDVKKQHIQSDEPHNSDFSRRVTNDEPENTHEIARQGSASVNIESTIGNTMQIDHTFIGNESIEGPLAKDSSTFKQDELMKNTMLSMPEESVCILIENEGTPANNAPENYGRAVGDTPARTAPKDFLVNDKFVENQEPELGEQTSVNNPPQNCLIAEQLIESVQQNIASDQKQLNGSPFEGDNLNGGPLIESVPTLASNELVERETTCALENSKEVLEESQGLEIVSILAPSKEVNRSINEECTEFCTSERELLADQTPTAYTANPSGVLKADHNISSGDESDIHKISVDESAHESAAANQKRLKSSSSTFIGESHESVSELAIERVENVCVLDDCKEPSTEHMPITPSVACQSGNPQSGERNTSSVDQSDIYEMSVDDFSQLNAAVVDTSTRTTAGDITIHGQFIENKEPESHELNKDETSMSNPSQNCLVTEQLQQIAATDQQRSKESSFVDEISIFDGCREIEPVSEQEPIESVEEDQSALENRAEAMEVSYELDVSVPTPSKEFSKNQLIGEEFTEIDRSKQELIGYSAPLSFITWRSGSLNQERDTSIDDKSDIYEMSVDDHQLANLPDVAQGASTTDSDVINHGQDGNKENGPPLVLDSRPIDPDECPAEMESPCVSKGGILNSTGRSDDILESNIPKPILKPATLNVDQSSLNTAWGKRLNLSKIPKPKRPYYVQPLDKQ